MLKTKIYIAHKLRKWGLPMSNPHLINALKVIDKAPLRLL